VNVPPPCSLLRLVGTAISAALLLPASPVEAQDCTPSVVLVNARVFTVERSRPWAEAVAVCADRIAAVGATDEIRRLAAPATRIVDAKGRLVVPGFNDSHVHLLDGAKELLSLNLRDARSAEDMAARVRAYAATVPKGRWLLGGYWDHEAWPGHALPTRALMDAAAPDHPVFLQRLDGHMGVANSRALALAHLTRDTPVPEGGAILKDASGEPTGILKDNAMNLVEDAVPPPTYDETLGAARAALRHAASLGVTTVQDLTTSADQLRAYQALRASGELPVRIYSVQERPLDQFRGLGAATGFGDDWVRLGGVKFFADGSMGSGTAAFYAPYADDPSTSGLLLQSPEALRTMVFDADAAGFQVEVHAIGDRANAVVLDIFDQLAKERGGRDRRPRIEHAQVVRDTDKTRFARLGVIASIQPSHCTDDMRWAEKRIGRDRCAIAYDFKSFVDAGVHVAFGTDWFVEPLDPMIGLHAAVTRQFADGTPPGGWFPEERLTMEQAVEFYTLGSAYAEFAETRKGSIAAGKLADLVILSRDLFTVPPGEILGTKAVLTMVGGRVVYEAPE
jgi:predicted amidohydrolase YtcJ